MRFLAIDPSSTKLGWAVMDGEELITFGTIDTERLPYEDRFRYILGQLSWVADRYDFAEVACERAIRFEGRSVPALEVAVTAISKWVKRERLGGRHRWELHMYSPAEWKVSVAGSGHADKQGVARAVCLVYPRLPGDVSDHVTDAIGIGWHHWAIRRLEEQAGE